MTRYRNRWGSEEVAEFEHAIEGALDIDGSTTERAEHFREHVEGAIQAHRPWARDIEADALSRGYKSIYRQEARRGTVLVSTTSGEIERPSMISVARHDEGGVVFQQLSFYAVMNREQIREKRNEYLKQIRAYDANVQMMDKLTAMLDASGSDDLETAAASLGVSVEDWLSNPITQRRTA